MEPLPIVVPYFKVGGHVESTHVYQLRLTPYGRYTLDSAIDYFDPLIDDWVVTVESSKKGKEHFHFLLYSDSLNVKEDVAELVSVFLHRYWTSAERKRGYGNKQYNLQVTTDAEQALTYILKDGGILRSTPIFTTDLLSTYRVKSFPKFSKDEFQIEFEQLKKNFKERLPGAEGGTSLEYFMIEFVKLKAKYRQPIKLSYIYEVGLANYLHRNPEESKRVVRDYLDKLNRY